MRTLKRQRKIMLYQFGDMFDVVIFEPYKKPDKFGHVGYVYGKNFGGTAYPENLMPTNDPKQLEEGEKLKKHYNLKD